MHRSLRSRHAGPASLAFAFAATLLTARAQTPPVELDSCVVSASRTPQDPSLTPSDVTAVPLSGLQTEQIPDLRTALAEVPGVDVVNTGAFGSQSSVFLRGADEDHTLFIVDGVRLNTATASYYNFLGAADLSGLDRFEVLLGPQSTLYGSEAMGGVILLETAHGSGAASGAISAYGGSFDTIGGEAAVQGAGAGLGYSASASHVSTDNERAYNKDDDWTYSARLEGNAAPWLLIGTTVRGLTGHYEEPGPTTYPDPGDIQNRTDLATAYAEAGAGQDFRSRLTAAWYQDQYRYDDGTTYDYYFQRNTRDILDWQNTWEAARWAEVVAGLDDEWSAFDSDGVATERLLAEYASVLLHPVSQLTLTGGLRRDDYRGEGSATTGRLGASYLLNGGATKLRATCGTGFNEPTPADRYGEPPYYLPNPGIKPESSRGWDAGIDQKLFSNAVALEATYFQNRFSDLLDYEVINWATYQGEEVNLDRATTRGAEIGLRAALAPGLTLRTAYTYLDARDDDTGERLIRRPRHTLDAGLDDRVTSVWTVGVGVHVVGDVLDGDPPARLSGYTTFRVATSYQISKGLRLKLRAENLLNRAYQEVEGYPALPRAVYGGAEWTF